MTEINSLHIRALNHKYKQPIAITFYLKQLGKHHASVELINATVSLRCHYFLNSVNELENHAFLPPLTLTVKSLKSQEDL